MAPGDVYLEQTNHFWILLMGALTWGVIWSPLDTASRDRWSTQQKTWLLGGECEGWKMWQCGNGDGR